MVPPFVGGTANHNRDKLRDIALRKRYAPVWRGGAYVHLYAQDKVSVFARQRDRHTVLVGLNAGTRPGMSIAVIAGNLAFSPSLDVSLTSVLGTAFFTL